VTALQRRGPSQEEVDNKIAAPDASRTSVCTDPDRGHAECEWKPGGAITQGFEQRRHDDEEEANNTLTPAGLLMEGAAADTAGFGVAEGGRVWRRPRLAWRWRSAPAAQLSAGPLGGVDALPCDLDPVRAVSYSIV